MANVFWIYDPIPEYRDAVNNQKETIKAIMTNGHILLLRLE